MGGFKIIIVFENVQMKITNIKLFGFAFNLNVLGKSLFVA